VSQQQVQQQGQVQQGQQHVQAPVKQEQAGMLPSMLGQQWSDRTAASNVTATDGAVAAATGAGMLQSTPSST
jgi:hypothetical protein